MSTAVVLAGAVARGAFEAGVLSVIARKGLDVSRVVATSAGALNGALFAAGVRFQRLAEAGEALRHLWEEEARWPRILKPSLSGMLGRRGFSSTAALEALIVKELAMLASDDGAPSDERAPIALELITTRLAGQVRASGESAGTTFEHALAFADEDFDEADGRARIARGAVASAAFPFLFVPVEFAALGPCIDGGAVNNTPISYALDANVERVIVVTGNPLRAPGDEQLAGLDLVGQAVDIAVNERLFRDLLQARKVNGKLEALEAVAHDLGLSDLQREALTGSLGWRRLEIVEIAPERPLAGNAFSALGSRQLRREYVQTGIELAERALATEAFLPPVARPRAARGLQPDAPN